MLSGTASPVLSLRPFFMFPEINASNVLSMPQIVLLSSETFLSLFDLAASTPISATESTHPMIMLTRDNSRKPRAFLDQAVNMATLYAPCTAAIDARTSVTVVPVSMAMC